MLNFEVCCKVNVKRKLRLQIFESSSRKFLHFQVTTNIVSNYEIWLMLFYDVKVSSMTLREHPV